MRPLQLEGALLRYDYSGMSAKSKVFGLLYRKVFKPVAFQVEAEAVHDLTTRLGERLENFPGLVSGLFSFQNPSLKRRVLGLEFPNPVGLAAGFDYDGHLAKVLPAVGFGFNTVGTVTAKPYIGNPKPRLLRLPKSRSILVNKGFKSEGALAVAARLDRKNLRGQILGVSVGASNLPEVNTISNAIEDYLFTFGLFGKRSYVSYFELNVSCPNVALGESFTEEKNFSQLAEQMAALKLRQPIFVKMPNEITPVQSDALVRIALKHGIRGFIFSNLAKDRKNSAFDKSEIERVASFKGNFSGRPTFEGSNRLIAHTRKVFGRDVVIVGCGGIFTPEDAMVKLSCGADLVNLLQE